MAEFLLIHGSAHGAWAWRDVLPRLQARGHTARAIDLPGHGDSPTPVEAVRLESYRDAIIGTLGENTVLVGHSMAGYPITMAADAMPDRIAALVYLCAYVPRAGLSLAAMRRAGPRQPLAPAILRSKDGLSFTLDSEMAAELFYHDCQSEAVDFALDRLCPQPVRPQEAPIGPTPKAESLPRHYVVCEHDRAIPPEYQSAMCAGFRTTNVHRLATGHSPFLAAPDRLARLLEKIAEST